MRKTTFNYYALLWITALFTVSCTSDDRDAPVPEPPPSGDYNNGVFVLNEGGFGYSDASVSFIDEGGQVYNGIFSAVNAMDLGDTAQSIGFHGDHAYIVVNNSSTIEIVNRYTFEHLATVTDMMVNPRYIEFIDNKGYISNWGDPNDASDDYIAVLDLETNAVETKIPVAEGPEKLLVNNSKLYVAHAGGYGYGNTISIISATSQSVTGTIAVADVPNDMVVIDGALYVICSGKASFTQDETLAKLFKINPTDDSVETSLTFPEGMHPGFLEHQGNTLYYVMENAVFKMETENLELPQNSFFEPADDGLQILYGFTVNDNNIYIADAKDYTSNGEVFIYDLNGGLQQQSIVELIPNSFYFNNQ